MTVIIENIGLHYGNTFNLGVELLNYQDIIKA